MLGTGALGYLGASEDDRDRWLANFRELLDGLDTPLQVLIHFTPGTGTSMLPRPGQGTAGEHDRRFAHWLSDQPSAQRRSVTLIAQSDQSGLLEAAVARIGVKVSPQAAAAGPWSGTETAGAFCTEGGWHRTYAVDRLPGTSLEPGWLLRLIPPRLDVTLSWHADPLPQVWAIEYLQRQLVQMKAQRLLQDPTTPGDARLAGAVPNAEELQRRLAASQEKAFRLAVYLTVACRERQDLGPASAALEASARAALCEIRPCQFRMADAWAATRPILTDRLSRTRVVDTSSLATLFPWLDADLEHVNGLLVGTSRSTGCPVILDPFDAGRFANANIGVFGHSGAGKTYLMSTLLMGSLAAGHQVFVIDPEHEYKRLAAGLDGVEIDLHLGSGHSLNVLELRPNSSAEPAEAETATERERWLGPAVADAVDLIAIICGGLDEPERAVAEAAVRSAYADEPDPVLADVAGRLPQEGRTGRILSRWVKGSLGAMFSAPTNVDLDAQLVVFGMRELREELVAPVHFLLAEALWSRIKTRGRRRLLVVDELGLLFEDPTIRRFVVALARRIRKYDGALVFATQNPGDLLTSDAGAVVATNPAIHFFGAQRPGEALKLQRAFQLSDRQRISLESARRGEFLLSAGPERLPVQVRASPRQAAILDGGRSPPRAPFVQSANYGRLRGAGHRRGRPPLPSVVRLCLLDRPHRQGRSQGQLAGNHRGVEGRGRPHLQDPGRAARGHSRRGRRGHHTAPPSGCPRGGTRGRTGGCPRPKAGLATGRRLPILGRLVVRPQHRDVLVGGGGRRCRWLGHRRRGPVRDQGGHPLRLRPGSLRGRLVRAPRARRRASSLERQDR